MGKRTNKRRNTLLCILLVMQIGLIVYMFQGKDVPIVTGGPLLEDFHADVLTSLTITGENAESITLAKQAKEDWTIQPSGLPASTQKIKVLLDKLTELKSTRLVTRTSASHNRLKVGQQIFMRRLALTDDQKETTILFGSSPNYKTMHVRVEGEDEVYLAQDLSTWEAPLEKESWWRTDYVKVDHTALTALKLNNAHGSITLYKDADGTWQLTELAAGQEFDDEALDTFLANMSSCTILTYLDEPVPPTMAPVATLQLTTADGTVTLEVGPENAETNEHLVKSSAMAFLATVSTHAAKDILERQATDLIQEAPALETTEETMD